MTHHGGTYAVVVCTCTGLEQVCELGLHCMQVDSCRDSNDPSRRGKCCVCLLFYWAGTTWVHTLTWGPCLVAKQQSTSSPEDGMSLSLGLSMQGL